MIHLTNENINIVRPTAVSIGKFDALHRGHMALINEQKKVAAEKGLDALVLTFTPHPVSFFTGKPLPLILAPNEKKELFASLGIDYYLEYAFNNEFAQTPPEVFLRDIFYGQLMGRAMVVAEDYRFGSKGAGDVDFARKVGSEMGFEVCAIPHVIYNEKKIDSGYLRQLVGEKDFALINKLCGRDFFIKDKVSICCVGCAADCLGDSCDNCSTVGCCVNQDGKGSWAALQVLGDKILPPKGVYDTITHIDGREYKSISHVVVTTVKTQILGYFEDTFGKTITVRFI